VLNLNNQNTCSDMAIPGKKSIGIQVSLKTASSQLNSQLKVLVRHCIGHSLSSSDFINNLILGLIQITGVNTITYRIP